MKLNEAFPNWFSTGGIITAIAGITGYAPPWSEDFSSSVQLDYIYHGNHSGDKTISPIVRKFVGNGTELSAASINTIAGMAVSLYRRKWEKEYNTLKFTYNPIENYNMTEGEDTIDNRTKTNTMTYNSSFDVSDNGTITEAGTESNNTTISDLTSNTKTNNLTDTKTLNLSDSSNSTSAVTGTDTTVVDETVGTASSENTVNKTYGFNSATGVNSTESNVSGTNSTDTDATTTLTHNTTTTDRGTATHTGTDTDTHTGTETDAGSYDRTGTDSLTKSATTSTVKTISNDKTGTDGESGTENSTVERALTRSGNIGVMTTQQMIQAERDTWDWSFYEDILFKDLDELLTLQIYE